MDESISIKDIQTCKSKYSLLGRGGFGGVYVCFYKDKEQAVKLIEPADSHKIDRNRRLIESEIDIMKKMEKSKHVINFIGAVEHFGWTGIMMDYMPRGDLADFVKENRKKFESENEDENEDNENKDKKSKLPLSLRLRILYETALGLSHLHNYKFDKMIAHNDLKPSNILLDHNLQVKICDFGGSNFGNRPSVCDSSAPNDQVKDVKTFNYASPECLENKYKKRTRAMDVFSYGMVMYFVLGDKHPFETRDSADMIKSILDGQRPGIWGGYSFDMSAENDKKLFNTLAECMRECWSQNAEERPKIEIVRDRLRPYNDTYKEIVEEIVDEFIQQHPSMKKWENKEKISLEDLCLSLSRVVRETSNCGHQVNTVAGVSCPMIIVDNLKPAPEEGDKLMIEAKDTRTRYTCTIESVQKF